MAQKVRTGLMTYNDQVKRFLDAKHEHPTLIPEEVDIVLTTYTANLDASVAADRVIEARRKETE